MKAFPEFNPVDPETQPCWVDDPTLLTREPSAAGLRRIRSRRGEPLFLADWDAALFLHFEVSPEKLRPWVPFELDRFENGRAFVSLVAFTMRRLRLARGGAPGRWMFRPIATHPFLNVRTYVRGNGGVEPGIHFLREWLPNRLACLLGPPIFGLPYRWGWLDYRHDFGAGRIAGEVRAEGARLAYRGTIPAGSVAGPCRAGTLDEFLLERYTAFTVRGRRRGFFRVWHEPWDQVSLPIELIDRQLLEKAPGGKSWAAEAEFVGANFAPGSVDVWMGRPAAAAGGGNPNL
ncbi:MAG: DUF2071 domain-containing protein [Verrucomicrobiae bacterium]|nr:DUF2071 domain-containing protein [Verrucomicrobiae bacterium]